ncbi:MAG: family 78 glycoside hydrolase catalytic domain [Kiritimatiellae bacterium]|nr:family 78 glycoside hydrolase catalytic domain [Kiritimatiellia bacterium]
MKRTVLAIAFFASAAAFADWADEPWIGDGRPEFASDEAFYGEDPAPAFRTTFVSPPASQSPAPRLELAVAGYYSAKLNGRPLHGVSRTSVMPLFSPYDHTIYADSIPLPEKLLKPSGGTNELEIALGNGWYNLPPLRFWGSVEFRAHLAHGRPCFKARLAGGGGFSAWRWRETNVLRNCLYLGAEVDATRPCGAWRPACAVRGPKGRIVPRAAPPIDVFEQVPGKSSWLREGEVQVVDFGANGTGVPKFLVRNAARGTRVEIVYGERLNADGSVNALTQTAGQIKRGNGGPGAPRIAMQRDVYVCAGGKVEVFEPPFVWHVCRYAEVRGLKTLLRPGEALIAHTASVLRDAPTAKNFKPAKPEFGRLHELCRRTFLANLMGVQSDCPGRERLGYGGDISASCEAFILNWDMKEFYLKTLQDFADEAAGDGWITETAPFVGIADRGGIGRADMGRAGPVSWSVGVPILMDAIIRHYPDAKERALAFYPTCARYVRQWHGLHPGVVVPQCIGDHEALERAPDAVTATAHWHRFVELTASFAGMLGRAGDQAEFAALDAKIKEAFAKAFVTNGVVANGTQSAQAIALYHGLVPAPQVAAAEKRLLAALEKTGYGPTTGFFGTRYMLMYLSEHGMLDAAEKIVLHEGFPGWLHMLDRGATTLWETWKESDDVFSNCHPMFGSVDEWILKYGAAK